MRRTALLCTAVLLTSGCFLFHKANPATVDHYAEGEKAYNAKKYDVAREHYRQVDKAHAKFQRAQFRVGSCGWRLGEREAGLQYMLRARAIDRAAFDGSKYLLRELAAYYGEASLTEQEAVGTGVAGLVAAGRATYWISDRGALSPVASAGSWEVALGSRVGGAKVRVVGTEGRLFAIRRSGSQSSLLAVDAASGQIAWERDLGHAFGESTPALAGDHVVAPTKAGLSAFDAGSGDVVWQVELSKTPGYTVASDQHVCAVVPPSEIACRTLAGDGDWSVMLSAKPPWGGLAVNGDRAFVPIDKTLYAYAIGKPGIAWKQVLDAKSSAPTVEGTELAIITQKSAYLFEATTGKPVWRVDLPRLEGYGHDASHAPTLTADAFVVASPAGAAALRRKDGALSWAALLPGGVTAGPLARDRSTTLGLSLRDGSKAVGTLGGQPW